MEGGGGPQVNEFEQVSSLSHQMSLAGRGPCSSEVPCLRWGGSGSLYSEVPCLGGWVGFLYGEVQYIIGNG